jgi:putative transposase
MGEVESRLKEQLVQTAYENNVEINELLIEEDHVHLIVEVDPQLGVNNFVRIAKGVTSRVLREEFPHLRKQLPTLWTVSYLVATVGGTPLSMIKQYIENQQRSEAKTSKQRWEDYLAGGKLGV